MNNKIKDELEQEEKSGGFMAAGSEECTNRSIALTPISRFFWAIVHQALASRSKSVQPSPTILFGGLTLTSLHGARFAGSAGLFFDN